MFKTPLRLYDLPKLNYGSSMNDQEITRTTFQDSYEIARFLKTNCDFPMLIQDSPRFEILKGFCLKLINCSKIVRHSA